MYPISNMEVVCILMKTSIIHKTSESKLNSPPIRRRVGMGTSTQVRLEFMLEWVNLFKLQLNSHFIDSDLQNQQNQTMMLHLLPSFVFILFPFSFLVFLFPGCITMDQFLSICEVELFFFPYSTEVSYIKLERSGSVFVCIQKRHHIVDGDGLSYHLVRSIDSIQSSICSTVRFRRFLFISYRRKSKPLIMFKYSSNEKIFRT